MLSASESPKATGSSAAAGAAVAMTTAAAIAKARPTNLRVRIVASGSALPGGICPARLRHFETTARRRAGTSPDVLSMHALPSRNEAGIRGGRRRLSPRTRSVPGREHPAAGARRRRLHGRVLRRRHRAALAARLAGVAVRQRLDDPGVSARTRRPELHARANAHLPRDDGKPTGTPFRSLPRLRDRHPEPARVRQRGTARASRPRPHAATRFGASA